MAAGALAFSEFALIFSMAGWCDVMVGEPSLLNVPKWVSLILLGVLYAANDYPLVGRRIGTRFDTEFMKFKQSRKSLLIASTILTMLIGAAFCLYSVSVHRTFLRATSYGVH